MGAGMIVLTVFGSLLLLIVLLLLSHVRLRVLLNEGGASFRLSWLFIRKKMKIEDAEELFDAHKKEKPKTETEPERVPEAETEDKKKLPLAWQFERIARLLSKILDRVHSAVTLRTRRVTVVVSTDDAAKTALLYGAVSAALAGLIEIVDRSVVRVKTKGRDKIDVRADFLSGKSRAELDLILSSRVFGMLRLLFTLLLLRDTGKPKRKKQAGLPKKQVAAPLAPPKE